MEKNPAKFRIDPAELAVRKNFIAQTREEVRIMNERTKGQGKNEGDAIVYEQEVREGWFWFLKDAYQSPF